MTYEDMIMNELRHIADLLDSINEKLDELQEARDGAR